MPFRQLLLYLGAPAALVLALLLFWLWQPEEQVRKHSAHLLDAIAHKQWARFASLIGDDYHDQWGNDRPAVLERTREVFSRLHGVQISAIGPNVRCENRVGYWRASIVIEGADDDELMAVLKARVNKLASPFELEWRRMSGKPWDWKLTAVRNAELNISAEY